jgi:hypothetical protein
MTERRGMSERGIKVREAVSGGRAVSEGRSSEWKHLVQKQRNKGNLEQEEEFKVVNKIE